MTTQPLTPDKSEAVRDVEAGEISLAPLFRIAWGYRAVVLLSFIGVAVAFLTWAVWELTFQPVERRASVPFRLVFDGADRGEYPNGLPFSHSEIISESVMRNVYASNDLERYLSYDSFKTKVVILQINRNLVNLGFEYDAILEDSRLTPVDRRRYEAEFTAKAGAMRVDEYTLNYITPDQLAIPIPAVLLSKVLADILAEWTDQAVTRKGVLAYRGDIVTANLLENMFLETDTVLARADILRGKVNRLRATLTTIGELPGASLARVGPDQYSLAEITGSLEDLNRYRLEPLTVASWKRQIASTDDSARTYVSNRRTQVRLDREAAIGTGNVLQETLSGFVPGQPAGRSRLQGENPGFMERSENINGTIGDAFLDRLISLANTTTETERALANTTTETEREYRLQLTERVREARETVVQIDRELSFYTELEAMPVGIQLPLEVDLAQGMEEFDLIFQQVRMAFDRASLIVSELSDQNLSPRMAALYEVTGPSAVVEVRALNPQAFLPMGMILLLIACLTLPVLCLVHHYFKHEVLSARK